MSPMRSASRATGQDTRRTPRGLRVNPRDGLLGSLCLHQHGLAVREVDAADLGHGHAARRPVQQPHPEPVLQVGAAWDRMSTAGAQLPTWFSAATELHRDWRNDVKGVGTLFAHHIPDYRNLIASRSAFTRKAVSSSPWPVAAGGG